MSMSICIYTYKFTYTCIHIRVCMNLCYACHICIYTWWWGATTHQLRWHVEMCGKNRPQERQNTRGGKSRNQQRIPCSNRELLQLGKTSNRAARPTPPSASAMEGLTKERAGRGQTSQRSLESRYTRRARPTGMSCPPLTSFSLHTGRSYKGAGRMQPYNTGTSRCQFMQGQVH